jgi:hypothetical protein
MLKQFRRRIHRQTIFTTSSMVFAESKPLVRPNPENSITDVLISTELIMTNQSHLTKIAYLSLPHEHTLIRRPEAHP